MEDWPSLFKLLKRQGARIRQEIKFEFDTMAIDFVSEKSLIFIEILKKADAKRTRLRIAYMYRDFWRACD